VLGAPDLHHPPLVEDAFGVQARALLRQLEVACAICRGRLRDADVCGGAWTSIGRRSRCTPRAPCAKPASHDPDCGCVRQVGSAVEALLTAQVDVDGERQHEAQRDEVGAGSLSWA
jgi:hypothetical protein